MNDILLASLILFAVTAWIGVLVFVKTRNDSPANNQRRES